MSTNNLDGQASQPVQPYPAQPAPPPYPVQPTQPTMPTAPYPGQSYAPQSALPYPVQPSPTYAQPYHPGYDANAMTPQRNTLVFVSSILLIVGGGFFLLSGLATVGLSGAFSSTCSQTGLCDAMDTGAYIVSSALTLIMGAGGIVSGIIGVMNASKAHKANLLLILGIGLCAITVVSQIVSVVNGAAAADSLTNAIGLGSGSLAVMSIGGGIIDLIVPVLFVIGALNLKKQAQIA